MVPSSGPLPPLKGSEIWALRFDREDKWYKGSPPKKGTY